MALVDPLARFRQLGSADRLVVLQALLLLPTIQLWLGLLGFKRTLALLGKTSSAKTVTQASEWNPRAWHIMQLTQLAARRGVSHGNCLSRSLTLWWLLRRAGIESELRFGVRSDEGKFLAHAWIELASHPLNDKVDQVRRYATFDPLVIPKMVEWA